VILLCVMGAIIGIWWPTHVFQAAENLNKLLGAVPESLWWLFGGLIHKRPYWVQLTL
jgi:hypothetical protein